MVAMPTNLTGTQALTVSREAQPLIILTVYQHAVTLHTPGQTEYAIDPEQLHAVFQRDATISTGLLMPDILAVTESGEQRTVVAYRPAQPTAIWLEGSDDPVVVPMPALVMRRTTGQRADYKVLAVKERPTTEDAQLYLPPLPNVGRNGVCWGTVRRPSKEKSRSNDLTPDWTAFLGSRFGNHDVGGKSRIYRDDIRKALLAYAKRDAWPTEDLVPAHQLTIKALLS